MPFTITSNCYNTGINLMKLEKQNYFILNKQTAIHKTFG